MENLAAKGCRYTATSGIQYARYRGIRQPVSEDRVERRLAAILAADVAGYSRLMGADEEGTLAALKALRRELIDPKVKRTRGASSRPPAMARLSIRQRHRRGALCRRGAARDDRTKRRRRRGSAHRLRIGINVGDIIIDEGDIFGDGSMSPHASRSGQPGGICVSRVVRDQVRDKLDFGFDDKGGSRSRYRRPCGSTDQAGQRPRDAAAAPDKIPDAAGSRRSRSAVSSER